MDSVGIPEEEVKLNDDTILDAYKGPPTLEVGIKPAAERIPASENEGNEARNECLTEIEYLEDESTDEYSPLVI